MTEDLGQLAIDLLWMPDALAKARLATLPPDDRAVVEQGSAQIRRNCEDMAAAFGMSYWNALSAVTAAVES